MGGAGTNFILSTLHNMHTLSLPPYRPCQPYGIPYEMVGMACGYEICTYVANRGITIARR